MRMRIPLSIIALSILIGEAFATEPPRCATSEELSAFSGKIALEAVLSNGSMEIMVMSAPDWKPVQLTFDPAFDGHPAWSVDGERIVFRSSRSGNKDLYLINPDGSSLEQLTSTAEDEDYARFHPDGERISFLSEGQIWIMNLDGTNREQITRFGVNESICWSADGKKLLFTRRVFGPTYDLYMKDMESGKTQALTSDGHVNVHGFFSPDGSLIGFSSKRGDEWDVYIMDSDGGNARRVTPNPGFDWMQGWSGDGKWLLTASEYEDNWDVYAVDLNGKGLLRLTCLDEVARYPSWWSESTER